MGDLAHRRFHSGILLWLQALLLFVSASSAFAADAIKGSVSAAVDNGFARLIFNLGTDVESQAHLSSNVIIVSFDRPVDLSVDRLHEGAPDYISAARRDPDGRAVRIALARKVTMNSMLAGDQLYVDLLPDTWTGLPPGLPREVIETLAREARDAEKKLKAEHPVEERKVTLIRVRVATQPTFTRYIFPLPEATSVAADNRKDRLTLTFNGMLNFDLSDAQANLPHTLQSLASELDQDTALVRFIYQGRVDVRTFREDNNYVVDIGSAELKQGGLLEGKPSDELAALALDATAKKPPSVGVTKPVTVAARTNGSGAQSKGEQGGDAKPLPGALRANPPAEPATPREAARPAPPAPPREMDERPPERSSENPAMTAHEGAAADAPAAPLPARSTTSPAVPPPAAVGQASDVPAPAVPEEPKAKVATAEQTAPTPTAPASTAITTPTNQAAARATIRAQLKVMGDNVTLRFPFAGATPAAVFRRADTLWIVFDTDADIQVDELVRDPSHTILGATAARRLDASIVRLKLDRPKLTSVTMEGSTWVVTLGAEMTSQTRALAIVRNGATSAQATATVTIMDTRAVHRLQDPEAGDMLLVVTALPPARGFISGQEFVEFRVLPSAQGIVVQPLADDLSVELSPDRVTLSRPGGLTLSNLTLQSDQAPAEERQSVLSPDLWDADRKADFGKRESQLMFAAAKASQAQRLAARVDLARFYLAWERSAEAKGVLDVALKDNPPTAADPVALVLRAVASLMLERPQDAIKDLSSPVVGNQFDAPLWRAWAYSRLMRWADASDGFRDLDAQIAHLPIGLQQRLLRQAVRVAIAVGDVTGAIAAMHQFEVVGVPPELQPIMMVYNGKLAERLGHLQDALQDYQLAADSSDRLASAQGTLREIELQDSLGRITRPTAIDDLETLTTIWRGDDIEIAALKLLAHLYTQEGRYRDSFHVMRTALTAHPNSELTRGIQDEASATFENLFLSGSGDALPAIDALALFYDFRDLTPIGRRGDEMIRRLSDRLVAVDLLDQAAELLQYQVDHRLQGAARAQVAMRLAVIYLMNHKPDDAFATLRATRVEDVSTEMRQQRLLVESRALSDLGRADVALDVIANVPGKEADRLRADILWGAHRWQQAAEQMERMYGDRWKEFTPLNDAERTDILRAAAGYALAGDALGLARFRERYVGKMGDGPDRRAFDVITEPVDASGADFRTIAHSVAAVDTLDAFLRDLEARYPATGALPPNSGPLPADNTPTGSIPPRAPKPVSRNRLALKQI